MCIFVILSIWCLASSVKDSVSRRAAFGRANHRSHSSGLSLLLFWYPDNLATNDKMQRFKHHTEQQVYHSSKDSQQVEFYWWIWYTDWICKLSNSDSGGISYGSSQFRFFELPFDALNQLDLFFMIYSRFFQESRRIDIEWIRVSWSIQPKSFSWIFRWREYFWPTNSPEPEETQVFRRST